LKKYFKTLGILHIASKVIYAFSDYNAFRGGLKSALRRTFLTTKGAKGGHKILLNAFGDDIVTYCRIKFVI